MYFPDRQILLYFLFPIPAKYFVMIIGAISLLSAIGSSGDGVAHVTHLGGLLAGLAVSDGGAGCAWRRRFSTSSPAGASIARGASSTCTPAAATTGRGITETWQVGR